MPAVPFISWPFLLATLAGLLGSANASLLAQSTTLKQCGEALSKKRNAITQRRLPIAQSLFPSLDPRFQALQQANREWGTCVEGQEAPLSSYKSLTSEAYDPASLAGKVVVINFWFMNCGPCRAEMPALNKLVEEYKGRGVVFLGLTPDKAERITAAFRQQNRFDFTLIADARQAAILFAITGYPTTYVVDQGGIIRHAWTGFVGGESSQLAPYYEAKSVIDRLLTAARR